jgi:hypothetical protein
MKLIATVASQRAENISSRALGMDANHRRRAMNIAKNQRQRGLQSLSASCFPFI